MADLEPLLRFWRALDDLFERVDPTPWGAVVTDASFPTIWDVNYARVETREPVSLDAVETELAPALERSRALHTHVLLFHPEDQTSLIAEASTRGDRLSWDAVMELRRTPPASSDDPGISVEEVPAVDETFWTELARSLREFDVTEAAAVAQILRIEREVLVPAGRRWFAVHHGGTYRAFGSLTVLQGMGFVDHVVTFPDARRRGFATAIVRRIAAEARTAGAGRVVLLAEPGGNAQRLYEHLGFTTIAQLAATLRPVERPRAEEPPVC